MTWQGTLKVICGLPTDIQRGKMGHSEFWDSFQCALLLPAWELGGLRGGGCGGKKGLPGVTQPLCPFLRALLPPPAKVSAFTPVRKNEK